MSEQNANCSQCQKMGGKQMEDVKFERDESIEIITLNRPDKLNSLSYQMVEMLGDRFTDLQFDDDVRAVIVTANGEAFCAGADLGGAGGREDAATPLGMRISARMYSRMIRAMWDLEKPIVGAINGVAAGGGCNFALSCDLVVASEKAEFIQVFTRRGLVADSGGTFLLPRLIGLARAKELMFFAEPLKADEALRLGAIYRVVPHEKLMDEAMAVARRLAVGPTRAIGMIKTMLNRSFETDLESALDREGTYQGIAVSTSDVIEGITAFIEKRKPHFRGK